MNQAENRSTMPKVKKMCSDIKKALPKRLNAATCRGVEECLKTCLKVIKQTDTDKGCFYYLKREGLMFLVLQIMRLWSSSDQTGDLDNVIRIILEILSVITDRGAKSSQCAAIFITDACLDVFFKDTVPFLKKIQILNRLNLIIESTDASLKKFLLERHLTPNVNNLFQLVLDVGDYEFQVALIEFIFRLMPFKLRLRFSSDLVRDLRTRQAFLSIKDSCFEADCREFLNQVNSDQGTKRKVFSYPCSSITFGVVELQKPSYLGYNEFWLDINMTSERIIIIYENTVEKECEEECWDTLCIWKSDITKCECAVERGELHVELSIKSTAACIPSSKGSYYGPVAILHVFISQHHNLQAVLTQFLGNHIPYTFRSGDEESEGRSYISPFELADSPGDVGCHGLDHNAKMSVPLESMYTPASCSMKKNCTQPTPNEAISREMGTRSSSRKSRARKKFSSSKLAPRRSGRLESKSASPVCSESPRKLRSNSEPAVSVEESSKTWHGSQRQMSEMEMARKSEKPSLKKRNRKFDKEPSASFTQSGNKVKNYNVDEKLGQLFTSPKLVRCAKYILRGNSNRCSGSKEEEQMAGKTGTSRTVSPSEVDSKLQYQPIKNVKKGTLNVKSKEKTEQKTKPRKNTTMPLYHKAEKKAINKTGQKKNLGRHEKMMPSQVVTTQEVRSIAFTALLDTNKKPVKWQKTDKVEAEQNTAGLLKLNSGTRPELSAEGKKTTNEKVCTLELSKLHQEKLDSNSSLAGQAAEKTQPAARPESSTGQQGIHNSIHGQASSTQETLHHTNVSRQKNQQDQHAPLSPSPVSLFQLPPAETCREYQFVPDDDDDTINMSLIIEIEKDPFDTPDKNNSSMRLNHNPVNFGNSGNDKHVEENQNKKAESPNMIHNQMTPVLGSKTKRQDSCSSSVKKTAHWRSPMSVTHGYELDDDSSVTCVSDFELDEKGELQTQEERQYRTDADLQKSQSFSHSKTQSVKKSKNISVDLGNHGNKSKQRGMEYGLNATQTNNPSKKGAAKARDVCDESSVLSPRKLRQRVHVSYNELSECSGSSDELKNDTSYHCFVGKKDESLLKDTHSRKRKYSVDANMHFDKGKFAKDNGDRKRAKSTFSLCNDESDDNNDDMMKAADNENRMCEQNDISAGGENGYKTPSLMSHLSPINFCSVWSQLSGNNLYQITPRDRNDSQETPKKKKRKRKNQPEEDVPATTIAREVKTADRKTRLVSGSGKWNTFKTQKTRKWSDRSSQSSSGTHTDAKTEISWIDKKKPKRFKGDKKYGHVANRHSSFSPEYVSSKINNTSRKEESFHVSPGLSSLHIESPSVLSAERFRDAHAKSAENSDADERASLKSKLSQPRTSVCGSAISLCSFLSQLSQHTTVSHLEVDEDAENEQQLAEEPNFPVYSPEISFDLKEGETDSDKELCVEYGSDKSFSKLGSKDAVEKGVHGADKGLKEADKHSSDTGIKKRGKKQQSVSGSDNNEEGALLLKRFGLLSGPSSVVRPRKSVLQSQLMGNDSTSSENDDDGIPEVALPCLQPRQLFPMPVSKTAKQTQRLKGGNVRADWASDTSEEDVALPVEETMSQLEYSIGQPGPSLTSVIQGLDKDLQHHVQAQEKQVQQLASQALKLSQKRLNQLLMQDKKQWETVVKEFREQLEVELCSLEQEVTNMNKVEKKSEAIYLEHLKLLSDKRARIKEGVESSNKCFQNLRQKVQHIQGHTEKIQIDMEIHMKQDMDRLKSKLLLDMQYQQLKRVRESIQKSFL